MPRRSHVLLLTLGAAAGVVAGALIIDRLGGADRLLRRLRPRTAGLHDGAPATDDDALDSDDLFRSAEGEADDLDAFDDADRARWRADDDEFVTARPSSAA